MPIEILHMDQVHWEAVREIFHQGIDTGNATFEKDIPDWDTWEKDHLPNSRLVATHEDIVIGWAALSHVSRRQVYGGVAEVSLYIENEFKGHGIGGLLLSHLIDQSEQHGFWTLQAGIFPENAVSIALFEKNGFRKIGVREKIGKMNDVWRDVVLLERRSAKIW